MSEHQKPQSDILAAFQSVIKNCLTARDAQKLTDSSVEFVEPIDHVYELERCHQYQARRKARKVATINCPKILSSSWHIGHSYQSGQFVGYS